MIAVDVATKRCNKCGEEKPLEEFSIRKSAQDGRGNTCPPCKNKWNNRKK